MTRIRQFAKDMSISYDKAKKLIDKGKKRKDGGSNVLEGYMPIIITPIEKKKKKKVPMPKPRPKSLKADKTESLDKEFSKNVAKQNEKAIKGVKKAMGGLKDVPPGSKGKGLSKLPTPVRNKMGFKKKGGTMKMRGGGMAIQGTGFRGVR
tara:strand:- start:41 stop:490 length:450 start_codon:yes stop_codon:yes gene_type:complete